MTTLQDALCKEIKENRIDDETPSMEGRRGRTSNRLRYQPRTQSRRRHTFSISKSMDEQLVDHSYTLLKHSPKSKRKRSITQPLYAKSVSLDIAGDSTEDFVDSGRNIEDKDLKTGWLYKTSRLKTSKTRGHRQHRKFKLTAHSLGYSNLLQQVRDIVNYLITTNKRAIFSYLHLRHSHCVYSSAETYLF